MRINEVLNLILELCQYLSIEEQTCDDIISQIAIRIANTHITLVSGEGYVVRLKSRIPLIEFNDKLNFDGENLKSEHLFPFIEMFLVDLYERYNLYNAEKYSHQFDINQILEATKMFANNPYYIKLKKLALLQ